ncbi:1389_t:CDS:10 [Paraglomus brasilianum]|uniref:1389_t:CDS:1 n=1 Tax=Paraglomus brasilianum TaxID=144538 RepID=A0A9N8ZIH8_9GLOM|nr:1389_t:CDS:10 [Paraglomus brasilianum]
MSARPSLAPYSRLLEEEAVNEITHPHHDSELLDDLEKNSKVTLFLWWLAVVISLGGFLFGYDTGVISSAMLLIEKDFVMTAFEKGMIVGGTTMGAFFGGLGAGYISDTSGRRFTLVLASVIFVLGAIILAFCNSYGALMLGRIIVGLGVGLASMVVPLYISEISPRYSRGRLVTVNVLMITGGQVIAYFVGVAYVDAPDGWRWMFGLSALPAIFQLIALPFIPESPRYLVRNGSPEGAKGVLRQIYPGAPESFVNEEIAVIRETLSVDANGSYRDLVRYPNFKPLIIACGLQAIQQLSGFDTAMYYGGTIMKMAGFETAKSAVIVSISVALTNFAMTVAALYIIDTIGRRQILLSTMLCMIFALLLLGFSFITITGFVPKQPSCTDYGPSCGACRLDERCNFDIKLGVCNDAGSIQSTEIPIGCSGGSRISSLLAIGSLVFYVASYALGLGHAPWLIQSELFPLNVRGRANGVATATNWICNLAIAVTFLPLTETITASGTFWLYATIMLFGWIFVYRLVPETKGKSLEEIQDLFTEST